jgi:hypothetical protein
MHLCEVLARNVTAWREENYEHDDYLLLAKF